MAARKDTPESFLQRWSRRKNAPETPDAESKPDSPQEKPPSAESAQTPPAETTETDAETPIWQRADVDPAERRQALKDLFQQSKFNQTDGLEEYENDYNYQKFAKLGSIVTHEMRRFIERQTEQSEHSQNKISSADDKTVNIDPQPPENDEDNPLG